MFCLYRKNICLNVYAIIFFVETITDEKKYFFLILSILHFYQFWVYGLNEWHSIILPFVKLVSIETNKKI